MNIGIVFPGYGSQFVGMGKDLYDESRLVQEFFEEAHNCLDINFVKLCFASSDNEISKIYNAYLSLFLVETSLFRFLNQELNLQDNISLVAGQGIGRYSAIFSAGGFSFPDGLYLLKKYAQFYVESLDSSKFKVIKIIGLNKINLDKILEDYKTISFAARYSDKELVISGEKSEVNTFEKKLLDSEEYNKDNKIKIIELSINFGLHSDQVPEVADKFKAYLEKVDFKDLKIPFVSAVRGQEVKLGRKVKEEVIAQITKPVLWQKVLNNFKNCDLIIEVGPKEFLSNTIKDKYPDKKVISFNKLADLDKIKNII